MCDFLFTDDCAVNASSEDEMQRNMDTFPSACDDFALNISTKKTEVIFQPHTNHSDPTVTVKGQKLQTLDKFTFLGSTMSGNVLFVDEADAKIAKASTFFRRLRVGTTRTQSPNKPESLQSCSYDHSLRITWQDMIPDKEVLESAGLQSIHTLLKKAQFRWASHVVRMSDEKLTKHLLYGELSEGRRSTGGQRKRYKDSLKSAFEINKEFWESFAAERGTYEYTRICPAEENRLLRKSSAAEASSARFHLKMCVHSNLHSQFVQSCLTCPLH